MGVTFGYWEVNIWSNIQCLVYMIFTPWQLDTCSQFPALALFSVLSFRVCSHAIKVFLPPLYLWHSSCEKNIRVCPLQLQCSHSGVESLGMRLMWLMVRTLQLKLEILDLIANLHLSLFDLIPPTVCVLFTSTNSWSMVCWWNKARDNPPSRTFKLYNSWYSTSNSQSVTLLSETHGDRPPAWLHGDIPDEASSLNELPFKPVQKRCLAAPPYQISAISPIDYLSTNSRS